MISMLIYNKIEKELHSLYREFRNQAAYLSDEHWKILVTEKIDEVMERMDTLALLDMACMDVTEEGTLPIVEAMRQEFEEMYLLLVADTSLSPMSYMKPSVRATSLLLRPCTQTDIQRVTREFVESYMAYFDKKNGVNSFIIDSRDGRLHIPYHKIHYFEAREKKLYAQTDSEEYGFYHTIDSLEEKLPGYFVRCHRSFIVNIRKIDKVVLSKNLIQLFGGWELPLSRSYKRKFKELGRPEREIKNS
ncbi:MAG: LytTR family transcriptional regulator DNA-binding domain-containing protein [Lachnospiraceae bacterium]|nr:LytTR family transcriptional regulator DNA-binding domain-containing protein [Lachnospiraceae bacterium]